MYSLLLSIIYVAFVSLGLPDSLLGSAWPAMHSDIGAPVSWAGIITFLIAIGTIISSLLSDRLTHKLGTGLVTAISVAMTAVALCGFSFSHSFVVLCLWAIPYGLGAGAVDAALNNFVALHYAARHMSWLHCFWGVGASLGPIIMGGVLGAGHSWTQGYRIVGVLQIILAALLFLSLSLWKSPRALPSLRQSGEGEAQPLRNEPLPLRRVLVLPGVRYVLVAFFGYCAFEATAILWVSTYLVQIRDVDVATASRFGSLFLIGITVGRGISGFIADRLGDRRMIRLGVLMAMVGAGAVAIPVSTPLVAYAGFIVAGLGCAPIYPSIIHATPANFGAANSQAVIGVQMASAYLGTTLMPLLFGGLADVMSASLLPFYLATLALLMLLMTERLNRVVDARRA